MSLSDVNYLAVGLATILAFALGGLWYSPVLFGKAWMAAHGYTPEQMQAMQASAGPSRALRRDKGGMGSAGLEPATSRSSVWHSPN